MIPKQILPMFTLVVPSTGKKVSFRQFTVREEKMMLQAQESEDLEVITNTVKEVIRVCVPDLVPEHLALFDVEYIITKIRAKSAGEIIELTMQCDKDATHARIPALIDLDKAAVHFPDGHLKTIPLYDDCGVIMRYPNLADLDKLDSLDKIDAVALCIESVYTADEVYAAAEQTPAEMRAYVESLTEVQLSKIRTSFLDTMPVFKYDLHYTCGECNHAHTKTVKGLASFFA